MRKVFYLFIAIALFGCNKISDKPNYSNVTTLRDSLIVKFKYEWSKENPDSIKKWFENEDIDSIILTIVNDINSDYSKKKIRFEYFTEYKDTLMAHIDYFFSDTLYFGSSDSILWNYFSVDLCNEDYCLKIEHDADISIDITYEGGKPHIDSKFILDSIAHVVHNHLESNLNYFYYDIATYRGELKLCFYKSFHFNRNSSKDLAEIYRKLGNYEMSERYFKIINDYNFRVKKYNKDLIIE